MHDLSVRLPPKSRILILAPLGEVKERDLPNLLKRLQPGRFCAGFAPREKSLNSTRSPLARGPAHRIEIVVDRLALDEGKRRRLIDSLELALRMGKRTAGIATPEGLGKVLLRIAPMCIMRVYGARTHPQPLFLSSSGRACPTCRGLGYSGAEAEKRGLLRPEPASAEAEAGEIPSFGPELPPCPVCGGTRLNAAARSVRLGSLSIDQVCRLNASRGGRLARKARSRRGAAQDFRPAPKRKSSTG